jgi:hypothetical protein
LVALTNYKDLAPAVFRDNEAAKSIYCYPRSTSIIMEKKNDPHGMSSPPAFELLRLPGRCFYSPPRFRQIKGPLFAVVWMVPVSVVAMGTECET